MKQLAKPSFCFKKKKGVWRNPSNTYHTPTNS